MPFLYQWQPGQQHIALTSEGHQFLTDQAITLELVANFYWAEFLENCNRLSPRIVQKVSREAAFRKPLQGYLKILLAESSAECFYCRSRFEQRTAPTVDHLIPWSFLLEDELWDLVLACRTCNC